MTGGNFRESGRLLFFVEIPYEWGIGCDEIAELVELSGLPGLARYEPRKVSHVEHKDARSASGTSKS